MSLSLSRILQRPSIQQAIVATQAASAEATANAQAGRVDSVRDQSIRAKVSQYVATMLSAENKRKMVTQTSTM